MENTYVLELLGCRDARWRELTSKDQVDRGDSPVPTVIMSIGIAIVAVALITWVGVYVAGYAGKAPTAAPPTPTFP